MIRIETHDLNKGDRAMLLALSAAFATVANGELPDAAVEVRIDKLTISPDTLHGHSHGAIDRDDAPDVGAPDAVEVFAKGDTSAPMPPAATVFAQPSPNAPAASLPTASEPVNAAAIAQNTNLAPAQNGATDLDADGLPWDGRIHSGNKTRNQDGRWKKRKGVDVAEVAQVEAQLRVALGNAPVAASPVAPVQASSVATIPAPPPVVPVEAVAPPPAPAATVPAPNVTSVPPAPPTVGQASSIAAPSAPVGVTPTNAESVAPSITFASLCGMITKAINGGTLTQDAIAGVLALNKLDGLPTLAAVPHMVPTIAQQLGLA